MRLLLWENDRADFLEGKQISEIAENCRPEEQEQIKQTLANRGSVKERLFKNLEGVSPLQNRNSGPREEVENSELNNLGLLDIQQPSNEYGMSFELNAGRTESTNMAKIMSPKPYE